MYIYVEAQHIHKVGIDFIYARSPRNHNGKDMFTMVEGCD